MFGALCIAGLFFFGGGTGAGGVAGGVVSGPCWFIWENL